MKIRIIIVVVFFVLVFINIYAEKKEPTPVNIKYSDGRNIYYLSGAKIVSPAGSVISIKNNILNITKGRIWVSVTKRSLLKISIGKKSFEINGATVDINTGNNSLTVFDGIVYVSGKRVNKGQIINLKNKNILVLKDLDVWQEKNIGEEVISVAVETQGKKEIAEKSNKKLKEIFESNYLTSAKENPEFLVKINISENDKTVKGTILHIPSEKIIGIIDENIEAIETEYMAINTGNNILRIINSFIEEELHTGRVLVMETTEFNADEIKILTGILNNIPGLKILEKKSYYEIKNVFKINYIGTGYDIAEVLKNKDINNKKINAWFVSKNNIKIKHKRDSLQCF